MIGDGHREITVTDRRGNGEEYARIVNAFYRLAGGGAAIDLGCGEAHVTKHWMMCTLVDLVSRPAIGRTIEQIDIRQVPKLLIHDNRRVNLALMTDVIEHLAVADAEKLLEELAPRTEAIVVFTPDAPYNYAPESTELDAHKSSWTPQYFFDKGWEVWHWPKYHRFDGGQTLGAFWAWKWCGAGRITPWIDTVHKYSGVAV